MSGKKIPISIQWLWVFGVSSVVLALISASVFLSIAIFAASEALLGSIPNQAKIAEFTEGFGRIIGPLATIALTLFATTWLALRVRTAPQLHGFIVGVIVAIANLVSDRFFSPPTAPDEWVTMLLCVLVGWIGGSWGKFILNNREAVYRTSQAIKGADRSGVVKAIGENLARPSVVWIALVKKPGEVDSSFAWASSTTLKIPPSIGLLPTPSERVTVSVVDQLLWHSSLLITLTEDESLFVASRNKNGFSRTDIQNYLTIGEQIALSLENLKLIEQARESGIIQERQRLADEIHDGLTQGFISIVAQLEMAESKLEGYPPELRNDLQPLLDQSRRTARDNLTAARQMTWALRPDLQKGKLLSNALKELAQRWSATNGIRTEFGLSGDELVLHPDIETFLLRTAREALNNILKHAQATNVTMTLTYLNSLVALDVQDNGRGFPPDTPATPQNENGFGLKSIREQAERLSGELTIESEPDKGSTIAVSIPVI